MNNRNYERATAAQIRFWELTDPMPEALRQQWEQTANGMGKGRVVKLLEATIEFMKKEHANG